MGKAEKMKQGKRQEGFAKSPMFAARFLAVGARFRNLSRARERAAPGISGLRTR